MRLAATPIRLFCIGMASVMLFSCNNMPSGTGIGDLVDKKFQADSEKEFNKLPGPAIDSLDKTLVLQAQQSESLGDYRRASQMYNQLVDKHPDKKEYVFSLADDLRRSGSSPAALKVIDPYLAKNPQDAEGLEIKGLILMNMGNFTEAGTTFQQVLSIDKNRWRTLNAVGILFAIKKMDNEAVEYYNAALKASPDNPGILNNLGLAQAMDKHYDGAITSFNKARNHLDAESVQVRQVSMNLALVYALAGRLDEAEATAAPYLSKAALYNNMGFYAYVAKNNEAAKAYFDMALNQNPLYYERAWKNLNAVNGDVSSEGNADETPHGDLSRSDRIVGDESAEIPKPMALKPVTPSEAASSPFTNTPKDSKSDTLVVSPRANAPAVITPSQ